VTLGRLAPAAVPLAIPALLLSTLLLSTLLLSTLFSTLVSTSAPASAASPRAHGDWGVAYGPAEPAVHDRSPRPAIVFLHGMWASPEDSCEAFESAATPFGFLVCPRGNAPLKVPADGGGWIDDDGDAGLKMWSGSAADAARSIHAALDAADALAPGRRAAAGGTLIGFSNGAYFAGEVACSEPGRWTGLVLMSMKLDLDPVRLRRAGVTRVVLAAGDRDEARVSMQALAARLTQHAEEGRKDGGAPAGADAGRGLESRFMSLGDVGHTFPSDIGARMCDAISWVRSDAGASTESPCKTHR
jgi:predicted esterase